MTELKEMFGDDKAMKIATIKGLRNNIIDHIQHAEAILNGLDRGTGAREIAVTRTHLQDAKHWITEALSELGYKYKDEYGYE